MSSFPHESGQFTRETLFLLRLFYHEILFEPLFVVLYSISLYIDVCLCVCKCLHQITRLVMRNADQRSHNEYRKFTNIIISRKY